MKIIVNSRLRIEENIPTTEPHIIISIATTVEDFADIKQTFECKGILRQTFPDVEKSSICHPKPFTEDQARDMWNFVEQHLNDVTTIVVQCAAGYSRSPAVAAAISKILNGQDNEFFINYRPNTHIYKTMLNTCPFRLTNEKEKI
jgi:predicted protein tyrosine phosphatase